MESKQTGPAAAHGNWATSGTPGIQSVKQATADITSEIGKAGKEQAAAGVEAAASQAESLAGTVEEIAKTLERNEQPAMGRLANEAASAINSVSERLRTQSIDQLIGDVRRIASNNPGLFLLGSVVVGFGLARFLKSSQTGVAGGPSTRPEAADTNAEPRPYGSGDFTYGTGEAAMPPGGSGARPAVSPMGEHHG